MPPRGSPEGEVAITQTRRTVWMGGGGGKRCGQREQHRRDAEKREHATFKEFPAMPGDQSREDLLEGDER